MVEYLVQMQVTAAVTVAEAEGHLQMMVLELQDIREQEEAER